MNPEQALDLLDQAAASYKGVREDHQKLAMAVAVLRAEIAPKPAVPKKENAPAAEGTPEASDKPAKRVKAKK